MSLIQSALPPDEWKRLEVEGEARLGHGIVAGVLPIGGPVRIWGGAVHGTVQVPREALPGLIAVAIDALPPGHELQLSGLDAATLRRAARRLEAIEDVDLASELVEIADMITALTAPNGEV